MKEFPKMLYRDQKTYITVATGKEEEAARQNGYMDYADLPEREASVEGGSSVGAGVTTGSLTARIAELEIENEILRAKVAEYESRSQEANQRATDNAQANTGPDGTDAGKTDNAKSATTKK